MLPRSIGTLVNLRVLHVGCNPLENVHADAIRPLTSLVELDLGFSETLSTLPDAAFTPLQRLRILHIGNNRLSTLPRTLFDCAQLEQLHAYGNDLQTLPADIARLTKLQHLNVGRNQIVSLPEEIGKCAALHTLHLYENCLERLPKTIAQLPGLTILTAHANERLPVPPRNVRCAQGVRAAAEFYAATPTE